MILGAIGGSMILLGNASAAPATGNAIAATHLSWNGYNGNETIYMTKGVQNESYYLPEKNSTVYQSGDSNQANVSNQVALDFGAKLYAPSGLKPTYEYYSQPQGDLIVDYGVTIATATNQSSWYDKITQGSSVTTTTEELVSSYVNATGFSGVNSGVDGDTVGSDYAAALNDTLTALSGLNNTLGLSLLMGAISAIPYLGYFTIPVALSLTQFVNETNSPSASFDGLHTAQTVGFYVKQYTGYYDKWLNNSGYQNDYNYAWGKNLMSFSVGSYIKINQTDFGGSGVLVVNATNMLGNYGGGGVSTPYLGASKSLQIPIVPSNTITGKVENNNVPASNQEIVLTQTNLNNMVTQFYEKTDANGNYRFFAEPGRTYEIQVVTPSGLSAGNTVNIANDEGNSTLNLNLNIPGTAIFSETGLPTGTSWYVATSDGQNVSSTSSSISISLPYGTYSYTIGRATGYYPSPESGSIDVNQIGTQLNVSFSPVGIVTFTESGLASGTSWSVTLSNVGTGCSTSNSIVFQNVYYGSYTFTYNSVPGYTLVNSQGSFSLNSASISESDTYYQSGTITFTEGGLPSGVQWSVNLNGQTITTYAGSSIQFTNLLYADYEFSVSSNSIWYQASPQTGYVDLTSSSASQGISFSKLQGYPITFKESGLPSGTSWSVKLNGATQSSGTSSITFSEPSGTYSYSIPDTYTSSYTYSPYPSSGSASSDQTVSVTFTPTSCVYALTPILMANGSYEFAENVHNGDRIMTYNLTTGQLQDSTVQLAYETDQVAMFTINGYLKIAPDQKVLTEHGYEEAQYITLNDTMYNIYTHNWEMIHSISVSMGTFAMYDFYIGVNHNYIAWSNVMEDKFP